MRQRRPVLIALLLLAACSRTAAPSARPHTAGSAGARPTVASPAAPRSQGALPPAVSGPSSAAPAADPSPCPPVAGRADFGQLTDIRVGTHGAYDRITFAFMPGNTSGSATNYDLANVTSPTRDPSDKPMQVDGVSLIQLVFQGASTVDPGGVVTYHGPSEIKPGFPVLAEIELRGDFERVLSYVIGLNQHRCPVVQALRDPPRLVVDLPH